MKKLTFSIVFAALLSVNNFAQNSPKIHELGINFSNLNAFGFRYKVGSEKTLLRLTGLTLKGSYQDSQTGSQTRSQKSSGIGFNIGFEKPKKINEKFNLYYGLDLLASYWSFKYKYLANDLNAWGISPGIGVVLGCSYKWENGIKISAELLPSLSYDYSESIGYDNSTIIKAYSFGFTNSNASLTLAYCF